MSYFESGLFHSILRTDLAAFVEKSFVTAIGEPFSDNWHIRYIASHLAQVAAGNTKRLIINIPPRYLKSQCASVAFPAWILGHRPNRKILCCSHNMELAKKFSSDCLKVMQAPWYKKTFPNTHLNAFKSNQVKFETTKGGFRHACSTEGGITGHGGSLIIIDDPMSAAQAYSAGERKRIQDFYDKTLYTRLDDKVNGAIVLVMQRLHVDDLTGHLLEKDNWTVLNLPALSTEAKIYTMGTGVSLSRAADRPLDEKREPKQELDKIRAQMGSLDFEAQYQQNPTYAGQSVVKWEWMKVYDPVNGLMPTFQYKVQSWDTASKTGEGNDYTVCTTWGIDGDNSYLLDVKRVKLEFPHLKKLIQHKAMNADAIYIEDASSGTSLVQQLRSEGLYALSNSAKGDKVGRMIGQTGKLESGLVYVPKSAPWLAAFRAEISQFPNGKHDDQVDSLSQFLAHRAWILNQLKINPSVCAHLKKAPSSNYHLLA